MPAGDTPAPEAATEANPPEVSTTVVNPPEVPEAPVAPEEVNAAKIEIGRLRVHNVAGGLIEGSRDEGQTWQIIGHVVKPTVKVNRRGFTASKYGRIGTVVATAVNAIHLKAGQNLAENRGIIWSLAPKAESAAGRVSLQNEVSPGSAVYTDMPGGFGAFGGPFTPFVGNPIFLDNDKDNQLDALPDSYVPALGDVWVMRIERPRRYPIEIVFENRPGGLITIRYLDEQPRPIGQVLQPVRGVGRFVGSYFSDVGRLRANHNGVIDISTSPRGRVGSFQIVPSDHAKSPELSYVPNNPQWMIVGPLSENDPLWEGRAPLYSDFLRPRFEAADVWKDDWLEFFVGRFMFQVKKQGKDQWEPRMPVWWVEPNLPLAPWAKTALADVTHLRIAFPYTWPEAAPTTTATAEAAPDNNQNNQPMSEGTNEQAAPAPPE
ncbi:MAG: hypothetical protein M3347_06440 [Armatimonadota bacterium]|nr:hypothetical protein [Armatimonadota bacterium]